MFFVCHRGRGIFSSGLGRRLGCQRISDRLAFHEITFLLFVNFVRAGVHVFDALFAALARRKLLLGNLRLFERLPTGKHSVGNL